MIQRLHQLDSQGLNLAKLSSLSFSTEDGASKSSDLYKFGNDKAYRTTKIAKTIVEYAIFLFLDQAKLKKSESIISFLSVIFSI